MVAILSSVFIVRYQHNLDRSRQQELERRETSADVVRITHHLIVITSDLRNRVSYARKMLEGGGYPMFALRRVVVTIEHRYESLLDREAYQFLPGPAVDLIRSMSGSITGLCLIAEGIEKAMAAGSSATGKYSTSPTPEAVIVQLNELVTNLEKLLDHIYEIRSSIT